MLRSHSPPSQICELNIRPYPAHHGCQFSHLTVHANKRTQRFQQSFLMMGTESLTLYNTAS